MPFMKIICLIQSNIIISTHTLISAFMAERYLLGSLVMTTTPCRKLLLLNKIIESLIPRLVSLMLSTSKIQNLSLHYLRSPSFDDALRALEEDLIKSIRDVVLSLV